MSRARGDATGRRSVATVMTAVAVALITAVLGSAVPVGPIVALVDGAGAISDDDAATRAARDIAAARSRANDASDRLWALQSELELLREDQIRLTTELVALQSEVDSLREKMESMAVSRFVTAGSAGIPLLTDIRSPNDRMQAVVFAGIIADAGAITLDDFAAAREALEATSDELRRTEARVTALQEDLEQIRVDAEDEVRQLRALEEQRLQDEAVRRAVEAQRREEERQRQERERAEEAARRALAELAAATGPAPAAASGGTVGGRTGGGGGGSNPASFADRNFVDQILCPVVGASAYSDTWGAPRSGGRRHQGVDMIAPIGTPLQAVIGGSALRSRNVLGGITITLQGDNGHRYYYAHLSSYEGESGRVEAGQVIGYVGDTGNAYATPHLHFEIRPNGGVPVNPTASVRAAGC